MTKKRSHRLRGEPSPHALRKPRRQLRMDGTWTRATLVRALGRWREWVHWHIQTAKARNTLFTAGLQADLNLFTVKPANSDYPFPMDPFSSPISITYDREIELAVSGERHLPPESVWLLHAQHYLGNDELAEVLSPAHYRKERLKATKAISARLATARRWWSKRCEAYRDCYRGHDIAESRWPKWLQST